MSRKSILDIPSPLAGERKGESDGFKKNLLSNSYSLLWSFWNSMYHVQKKNFMPMERWLLLRHILKTMSIL